MEKFYLRRWEWYRQDAISNVLGLLVGPLTYFLIWPTFQFTEMAQFTLSLLLANYITTKVFRLHAIWKSHNEDLGACLVSSAIMGFFYFFLIWLCEYLHMAIMALVATLAVAVLDYISSSVIEREHNPRTRLEEDLELLRRQNPSP